MSQEIDSGLIEKKDEQINNTNISIGNIMTMKIIY